MRSVGIKELKNRLSEYVRLAAGGETVLVTDRDRVVATLSGPQVATVGDAMLADLVRQGVLRPALFIDPRPPPRVPSASHAALQRELSADRDGR